MKVKEFLELFQDAPEDAEVLIDCRSLDSATTSVEVAQEFYQDGNTVVLIST